MQIRPSSWSQVIPCGRTDGQTDKTTLAVDFRHFAKAPYNHNSLRQNRPTLRDFSTALPEYEGDILTATSQCSVNDAKADFVT